MIKNLRTINRDNEIQDEDGFYSDIDKCNSELIEIRNYLETSNFS